MNDVIIYFQKTYGLYFVEFRKAPNGKECLVLCHPQNKDWWINIIKLNFMYIHVIVEYFGNDKNIKTQIKQDLINEKYKNYGKKFIGKWLKL